MTAESDGRKFVFEAHIQMTPAMIAFLRTLSPGDGSATGNAMSHRHRVVIRDVGADYDGDRKQKALAAGIRAVTATPIIDSRLRMRGVLTLTYARPHHPAYAALRRLDACSRVAAQLLELFDRSPHESTARLSPDVRLAFASVRRLLPTCGRGAEDETVFPALTRHLDLILREFPA